MKFTHYFLSITDPGLRAVQISRESAGPQAIDCYPGEMQQQSLIVQQQECTNLSPHLSNKTY